MNTTNTQFQNSKGIQSRKVLWALTPVFFAFLLLTGFERRPAGTNELTRFATMRSIVESGSFDIDSYTTLTRDWLIGANGHHYANKPPAPSLVALPFFLVTHAFFPPTENAAAVVDRIVSFATRWWITMICQALLLTLAVALGVVYLWRNSGDSVSILIFVSIALFGNTAATLSALYMGHSFAAAMLLFGTIAYLNARYLITGIFLGVGCLSDVSTIPIAACLLCALSLQRNWKGAIRVAIGLVPFGIAWIAYYGILTGDPVAGALSHQNPFFNPQQSALGMFSGKGGNLIQILVGPSRGLIISEPWVFPALWILFTCDKPRQWWLGTGLIILILINSTFNGWHGGDTPGPRYLAVAFPSLSFLASAYLKTTNPRVRRSLGFFAILAVLYRAQVYATTLLPPITPMLIYQWRIISDLSTPESAFRYLAFLILVGSSLLFSKRLLRSL